MLRPMLAGMLSVLLVAGIIGLVVFLVTDEPSASRDATTAAAPAGTAATPTPTSADDPPPVRLKTLPAAAKAAGCTLQHPPDQGNQHEARRFTAADYDSNPPTSGTHDPDWYGDGTYAPGRTPELGQLVHALEHGRIEIQYRPGMSAATVGRLEELVDELDGYHILLFENATKMRYEIAATAWGHLLGCPRMNDEVFDALRAFHANYVDKGPETVP